MIRLAGPDKHTTSNEPKFDRYKDLESCGAQCKDGREEIELRAHINNGKAGMWISYMFAPRMMRISF